MARPDMSIKVERKLHDMRMADRIVGVRSTEQFVWHLLLHITTRGMLYEPKGFKNFRI